MTKHRKIAVCGGDERMVSLVSTLAEAGYECAVWGLGKTPIHHRAVRVKELSDALRDAVALVLPTPASRDSLTLNSPLHEGDAPKLSEIFDITPKDALVVGGSFSPSLKSELEARAFSYYDIVEREAFADANAVPTVEGALAVAICETKKTLADSKAAVVGAGRIGKRLADALIFLSCDVTLLSRKKNLQGYRTIHTSRVGELAEGYDIIFNTAPARVFSAEFLSRLQSDCTIIDLASAPYGADREEAAAAGVKYIIASALPGRFSPVSAGKIMGECTAEILASGGILP